MDGLIVSKNHVDPGTLTKKSLSRTSLTDPAYYHHLSGSSVYGGEGRVPSSCCHSSTLNSTDRSFTTTLAAADSPQQQQQLDHRGSIASLQHHLARGPRENDYESIPTTTSKNLGLQSLPEGARAPTRQDESVTSAHHHHHHHHHPGRSNSQLVSSSSSKHHHKKLSNARALSHKHRKQILLDENSTETIL